MAPRLLALHQRLVGPDDPVLIIDLIMLASACDMQAWAQRDRGKPKEKEAESHYRRVLAIADQALAPDDGRLRSCLHQLGQHYKNRRRYARAEPASRRLVTFDEAAVQQAADRATRGETDAGRRSGREQVHRLASETGMLAGLYVAQRRFDEAETLFRRTLALLSPVRCVRLLGCGPTH